MRDKHSPKKILLSIVGIVAALFIATGFAVSTHAPGDKPAAKAPATGQVAGTQTAPTHISYEGKAGKSALELLKKHAQVVTKQSSFGEYVDSINGLQGGTQGKYWTFYVNGTQAQVGAGAYITRAGDVVEWKFE